MNKLSILFVINSLEIGGAETFLLRLIKELKQSFQIHPYLLVLLPEKNDPTFANFFLKETNVQLIPKYKNPKGVTDSLFWKLNGLYNRIAKKTFYENLLQKQENKYYLNILTKKYKIDLINSHLLSSDIFAVKHIKPIIQKPLVITNQGCYNDYNNQNTIIEIIKNIDGITYVAEKNLTSFYNTQVPITKNRMLIYNGLAYPQNIELKKRESLGLSKNDFIIGQVSRSIETKGLEISIRAIILLVEGKQNSNIKLILAGPENEYYNYLKEKYKKYIYIYFVGQTMQPLEWIGMFDVGILPTSFPGESCPSSIIEYLALGKPVISTNIGEIPNMIKSGNDLCGIIVSEQDEQHNLDFTAFSEAILKYYKDKELLKNHSTIALKAFEKFSIIKTAESYMQIYNNALMNK